MRFGGDPEKAAAVYEGTTPLTADDIAEAVAWVLHLPAHVNINRIEMMPTCQACFAADGEALESWQLETKEHRRLLDRYRVTDGTGFRLQHYSPILRICRTATSRRPSNC